MQQQQPERTPTHSETQTASSSSTPEKKPSVPSQPPLPDNLSPFISVLITPKLTFSLQRKQEWRVPDDIPQAALREAFLSRFPMHFEPPDIEFKCATPALELHSAERLVYRIGSVRGGDDERLLLQIL